MRKSLARVLLFLLVALVVAQFIPVERGNPNSDPHSELRAEVSDVFRRACYDCHSNRTEWPWYARLAPVSWFLAHHVEEGREHLNFSLWNEYTPGAQRHLAKEIVEEVEEGKMPLPMYISIHPEAEVTSSEIDRLRAWSHSLMERKEGSDVDTDSPDHDGD
jgi:hypothetical protein